MAGQGQDISEQVRQFSSITGIGSDQARFFVESAGGDLEVRSRVARVALMGE